MRSLQSIFSHLFHPRRSNNHRARILHSIAYVYLSGVVIAFALGIQFFSHFGQKFGAVLGFASTITPAQVIEKTNEQRRLAGLPPLVVNQQLTQAALAKGQNMMTNQYWSHVAPDGTEPWYFIQQAGYKYRVAGENLARDFAETDTMVSAWMSSPTHKANILNSKYTEIGIAVISGTLEEYETTLVVQMFGQPAVTQPSITTNAADTTKKVTAAYAANPKRAAAAIEATEEQASLAESSEKVDINQNPDINTQRVASPQPQVLAALLLPMGKIEVPPLLTPLQISKAVFLSLIMLLTGTLVYDSWIVSNSRTVRVVGKNLAHIIFLATVAFLIIFFKAGLVG